MSSFSETVIFWEDRAKEAKAEADYYRAELSKAHALLGRVIHQLSERWDTVNLTEFHPTDNLSGSRRVGKISGGPDEPPQAEEAEVY